jgi:hypothetical protein
MPTLIAFVLRAFLVLAGLALVASLCIAFAGVGILWLFGAGWARISGRPVKPFVAGIDPRTAFRRATQPVHAPRANFVSPRGRAADISDVEPHAPRG